VPLPDFERPIAGESPRAFRAFLKYRDLGPLRSIDAVATSDAVARGAKTKRRHSGVYGKWSSTNQWVERAAAFDSHLEDARMRALQARNQALERRRTEFEFKNQQLQEDLTSRLDAILVKFDTTPITDVTSDKTETVGRTITRTRTKIKGLNGAGLAAVVRARNETARQATIGVRAPVDDEADGGEKQVDAIVWERRQPK
jgi:hypothetical protein